MNSVHRSDHSEIKSISDRISITKGKSAWLAYVENKIQNVPLNPIFPLYHNPRQILVHLIIWLMMRVI